MCVMQRGNRLFPSSTAYAKQCKIAFVVLLCSVLVGYTSFCFAQDAVDEEEYLYSASIREFGEITVTGKYKRKEYSTSGVLNLSEDSLRECNTIGKCGKNLPIVLGAFKEANHINGDNREIYDGKMVTVKGKLRYFPPDCGTNFTGTFLDEIESIEIVEDK